MKRLLGIWVAVTLAAAASGAHSQSFPDRVITLVNPYSAGGPADQVARTFAKSLGEELGQQVIVENKPGGGGGIAAGYVAKAEPDGYTLLLANNATQVMAPATTPADYDGLKDFRFLGMVANVSNLLVVHPSVKANTLEELIALAKANPGKLSYASSGIGGSPHIAAELLKQQAKIDMVHVPYKGAAPAVTDLVGGQTQLGIFNLSGVAQFVKAGKLRALAFASGKRADLLPDVPTFGEAGMPQFEASSWYAIAAPKGLAQPAAERLIDAIAKVQANPDFKAQIKAQGAEVVPLTPTETSEFVEKDARTTLDLIKSANLKLN